MTYEIAALAISSFPIIIGSIYVGFKRIKYCKCLGCMECNQVTGLSPRPNDNVASIHEVNSDNTV
jgi:hypothetical protein